MWGVVGRPRKNIQNCETIRLLSHMLNGNPRKTRKKGAEGIFKVLMVENFAKLRTDTKP